MFLLCKTLVPMPYLEKAAMAQPTRTTAPPLFADAPPASVLNASPAPSQTEVFAVHGADPEVLAYAMAKYSRSSLSMKDSVREISAQRAEQFLNTFYFQYGHRSIADLAHLAFRGRAPVSAGRHRAC